MPSEVCDAARGGARTPRRMLLRSAGRRGATCSCPTSRSPHRQIWPRLSHASGWRSRL